MADVGGKTYKQNGVKTIADNCKILWLNEKQGLDWKNLGLTT